MNIHFWAISYMNIHIAHDTKLFVTLRQGEKKQWNNHSLYLALTQTTILSPNHYTTSNFGRPCTQLRQTMHTTSADHAHNFGRPCTQLRQTMHTIPPNVYCAYLVCYYGKMNIHIRTGPKWCGFHFFISSPVLIIARAVRTSDNSVFAVFLMEAHFAVSLPGELKWYY